MNTGRRMIFWNYQILNLFVLVLASVFYLYLGEGMLWITLAAFAGLILLILLSPLNISVSRAGITSKSILRGWYFKWQDINSWKVVPVREGKYTIWFRTSGKVYKISRIVFRENHIHILKAYFEKYCGSQSIFDACLTNPNAIKSRHLDLVEEERKL